MLFYERMAKGDLGSHLRTTIVEQNSLLKTLQEQPESKSFFCDFYNSAPGHNAHDPAVKHSVESVDSQFFADNQSWLVKQIGQYLSERKAAEQQEGSDQDGEPEEVNE